MAVNDSGGTDLGSVRCRLVCREESLWGRSGAESCVWCSEALCTVFVKALLASACVFAQDMQLDSGYPCFPTIPRICHNSFLKN